MRLAISMAILEALTQFSSVLAVIASNKATLKA
jgi:hypothetical protein